MGTRGLLLLPCQSPAPGSRRAAEEAPHVAVRLGSELLPQRPRPLRSRALLRLSGFQALRPETLRPPLPLLEALPVLPAQRRGPGPLLWCPTPLLLLLLSLEAVLLQHGLGLQPLLKLPRLSHQRSLLPTLRLFGLSLCLQPLRLAPLGQRFLLLQPPGLLLRLLVPVNPSLLRSCARHCRGLGGLPLQRLSLLPLRDRHPLLGLQVRVLLVPPGVRDDVLPLKADQDPVAAHHDGLPVVISAGLEDPEELLVLLGVPVSSVAILGPEFLKHDDLRQ
mmetsp:Transcript_14975/g.35699  ORF Transcript_14975/g.35699 Transcript_14975/m.35699 type:complete len:277 (-) Transcript_14975:799-1629(-)